MADAALHEKLDLIIRQQQELLDRQAIWDVMMAYCRGMDRMDTALTVSAYHPDAIDDHGSAVAHAPEFVAWAERSHLTLASTQHMITNHCVELDGDVAHAESYWIATVKHAEDQEMSLISGRYIDRLERRDGRWAIAARKCTVEWGGKAEITPIAAEIRRNHNLGGQPARDRSDPCYERPLTVDPGRVGFGLGAAVGAG